MFLENENQKILLLFLNAVFIIKKLVHRVKTFPSADAEISWRTGIYLRIRYKEWRCAAARQAQQEIWVRTDIFEFLDICHFWQLYFCHMSFLKYSYKSQDATQDGDKTSPKVVSLELTTVSEGILGALTKYFDAQERTR